LQRLPRVPTYPTDLQVTLQQLVAVRRHSRGGRPDLPARDDMRHPSVAALVASSDAHESGIVVRSFSVTTYLPLCSCQGVPRRPGAGSERPPCLRRLEK
jgi:hypothetical protein